MNAEVQERIASMRRMLDDRQADDLQDEECWLGLQIHLSAIERGARRSLATETAKRQLEVAIELFTGRRSEGSDEGRLYARAIEALAGYEQALIRSAEISEQRDQVSAA